MSSCTLSPGQAIPACPGTVNRGCQLLRGRLRLFFDDIEGGFAITRIALTTTAKVPGASKEVFDKAAADAKTGCPISKLFANNTEIVLDAKLV